jgi:D-glycero-D-manno-heptose 1,7-bisphosphate phosphatase
MHRNRAVFLDREGVINRNLFYPDSGEFEGPRSVTDLELYPWTIPSLIALQASGFSLFIISNQPNYAKGKSSLETMNAIHEKLLEELDAAAIQILESYYCFHHPKSLFPEYANCDCRKPSPRFLFDAAEKYTIDLSHSWMVGDRSTDIACGLKAGVRTIRVAPDHLAADPTKELPLPHHFVSNLQGAAAIIVNER